MSKEHTILALDLALTSPGFAVLTLSEDGKPKLLESTMLTTKADQLMGERLSIIKTEFVRLIELYEPTMIVREKGYTAFPNATQLQSRVIGVNDLTIYELLGIEVVEIPVGTVKKLVAGKGNAEKTEVAEAVFKKLQISDTSEFYRTLQNGRVVLLDDKTDACAVGLAFYIKNRMIK